MCIFSILLRAVAFVAFCSTSVIGLAAEKSTIPQIQGTGHTSPFDNKFVSFEGIVTLLREGTFFVQDPIGDGNDDSSDGILVRRKPSGLTVGDRVKVEGTVEEQGRFGQFSTTTIKDPVFWKLGDETVPAQIVIGPNGLKPPTEAIVLPVAGFDRINSGADFFESLEGMIVRIESPIVVGPMSKNNVFTVVSGNGDQATGMNSLGGITATPGDPNPERIQIQVGKPLLPADFQVSVGDRFSRLDGVVTTDNGSYGIQLAAASGYGPKNWTQTGVTTAMADNVVTIAGYNVENLDTKLEDPNKVPLDADRDDDLAEGKFDAIAGQIVNLLGSPDIVALQEVQDNDGGEFSEVVAADNTLNGLTDAIHNAGGPTYQTLSLDPLDDSEGGQPGANIRVAYLFNPERVTLTETSVRRIEDPSFARTRLPLAASFKFGDSEIMTINVHFSSKSGSDPLYGTNQPPRDATAAVRTAQARAVREFIRKLAPVAKRSIVVLGDFNTYWYEEPLLLLTSGTPALKNMALDEPPLERVSYIFDGNSQSLDHVLLILGEGQSASMKTLHINSVFPESKQTSDHDPKHLSITFN